MSPALWMSLLLLLTLAPPALPKRGGLSMGRSGGMNRGSSAARTSGGLFGGSSSRSRVAPAPPPRSHGGGGFGTGQKTPVGGTWGNTGSHGTGWGHNTGGSGWNRNTNPKHSGSGWGHGRTSTFSKGSGVGSVLRSNTFKNAIVGAAAGYLTYQAGKAIIRAAAGPMILGGIIVLTIGDPTIIAPAMDRATCAECRSITAINSSEMCTSRTTPVPVRSSGAVATTSTAVATSVAVVAVSPATVSLPVSAASLSWFSFSAVSFRWLSSTFRWRVSSALEMRVSRLVLLLLLFVVVGGKRGGASRSRGTSRTRTPKTIKRVSKPGSVERTALFRSTILGAAAGYVTFKAGKHIVNQASQPMAWGTRAYYWDSRFMPVNEETPTQCIHQIDPQDPQLGKIVFEDDTRPTEIVYGCGQGEACCGFECCSENSFFKSLFSLLVVILVLSVLGVFCIEAFRWAVNCVYNCRHKNGREFQVLSI